jgi:hypothetical protein
MDTGSAGRHISRVVRSSIWALALCAASKPDCARAASSCRKVVLTGELSAGQAWRAPLGQGWVLLVLPIPPGPAGYSGWDLVVDRDPPAGYPDALLLATPPYDSINEREIGTTFGVRAQDAIGWNPRSFHFMVDPAAFRKAQLIYMGMARDGRLNGRKAGSHEADRLLRLEKGSAGGELRIEDVRLTPGIADAAEFAQAWALAARRTRHEIVAAADGRSSPRGWLAWMRFSVTLWLPGSWKLPAQLHGIPAGCVR